MLVIEAIAGIMLGLITLLIVASALGRYFFAWPIPDAFDVSRLLLGVAIMWGLASVAYHGTHIKVDLIAEMLGPRVRRVFDFIAWSVLLVFTLALTWKMFVRILTVWRAGEGTMDLRIPTWPFVAFLWAGVAVSIVGVVARLVRIAVRGEGLDHYESAELHDAAPDDGNG